MPSSDIVNGWSLKILSATCFILFVAVIKLQFEQTRLRHQLYFLQIQINQPPFNLSARYNDNIGNELPRKDPSAINIPHLFQRTNRNKRDVMSSDAPRGKTRPSAQTSAKSRRVRCRQKNNSGRCRRRIRHASDVISMLFKGGRPEAFTKDGGIIAPWILNIEASSPKLANNSDSTFRLVHGMGAVEIQRKGIYFIYAQVYYLTSERLNSFSINVARSSSMASGLPLESAGKEIALCSSNANNDSLSSVTAVSCYTSLVHFLDSGDLVFLQQRETKRRVILRDGHSYLGLVSLHFL